MLAQYNCLFKFLKHLNFFKMFFHKYLHLLSKIFKTFITFFNLLTKLKTKPIS